MNLLPKLKKVFITAPKTKIKSDNCPGPRELRNQTSLVRMVCQSTGSSPFISGGLKVGDIGDVVIQKPFNLESSHQEIQVISPMAFFFYYWARARVCVVRACVWVGAWVRAGTCVVCCVLCSVCVCVRARVCSKITQTLQVDLEGIVQGSVCVRVRV